MFMQQDWLMRQIEMMIAAIIQLLSEKAGKEYSLKDELKQERFTELKQKLTDLLNEGQLGEAENLLFFELEDGDESILAIAIDFYQKANTLSDKELDEQGFTRSELLEGLNDVAERYGLFIPGLWNKPDET